MDKNGTNAVNDLLATYGETGGINYLAAAATLPSRETIEEACADLMSLMFPGFRGEALVHSEDLPETTRARTLYVPGMLQWEYKDYGLAVIVR